MRKGTLEGKRIGTAFSSDGAQVLDTVDGWLDTAICSGGGK